MPGSSFCCFSLTFSLYVQLQSQQVTDHRAEGPEALAPHGAPVHGLQDAQRLSDLPTAQSLLQQLPSTHVTASAGAQHT